jgi:hypothetical protein
MNKTKTDMEGCFNCVRGFHPNPKKKRAAMKCTKPNGKITDVHHYNWCSEYERKKRKK